MTAYRAERHLFAKYSPKSKQEVKLLKIVRRGAIIVLGGQNYAKVQKS